MTDRPTFADGPPVPLLVEGVLDAATLRQLFADLAAAASQLTVREKGDARTYSGVADVTLAAAFDRLDRGETRAVQIRYHFDGHEWTDTVISLPTGFRVIRCQHDSSSS